MSNATLISDIIAFEEGNESITKHFPVGSEISIEDTDEGWFMFEDAAGMYYECEEQPEKAFRYDDSDSNNVKGQPVKAYVPVPNMTPLERKFLLL